MDLQVIHKIDSTVRKDSYINQVKNKNQNRMGEIMNGMQTVNNLCFLQIKGVNKLDKEINETQSILCKVIDRDAIHRNEQTKEVEGEESFRVSKSQHQSKKKAEASEPNSKFLRKNSSDSMKSSSSILSNSVIVPTNRSSKKLTLPKTVNYNLYRVEEVIDKHLDTKQLY